MKKLTTKEVIDKCVLVHGNKYDYSLVNYINARIKIKIICKKHGIFEQRVSDHFKGSGCKKCFLAEKRISQEEFIERSKKIHKDKYQYDKLDYKGIFKKVTIHCKEHGYFTQTAKNHLQGKGCKKCSVLYNKKKRTYSKEQFIEKANKIQGTKYNYDEVFYKNSKEKVKILCENHGAFYQKPNNHLLGEGCPECGNESCSIKKRKSEKSFIKQCKKVHNNIYDYSKLEYKGALSKVEIRCKIHGKFEQIASNHLQGQGCPICSQSLGEKELRQFLKKLVKVKKDRKVLEGKELDFLIKKKNLAIEYNGLYWHSSEKVFNDYHLQKTKKCDIKNIQLIHIFEDEWVNKKEIVKSRILNILNKTSNRIYARKCEIRQIPTNKKTDFLNLNHIQGSVGSSINLGLYYKEELVSIMTFGKLRKNLGQCHKKNHWELLRFCNKVNTTVVGGASKLLNYFIKNYEWIEIISYADRRWSKGDLYEILGFDKISETPPNYFYIKGTRRETRFKYRKSELIRLKWGTKEQTEKQIMKQKGFYRIYDCGSFKYKLTNHIK